MPRETNVTRVGPYALGRTLGKGAFGWVKLGVHDKTGVKVAVKARGFVLRGTPSLVMERGRRDGEAEARGRA